MKTFKLFPIFLIFASMLFAVPMLAPGAEPSFMGRTGASKSREETTNGRFPPPGPHLERRKAPAQASGGGFGSSQSTKARIKPKDKDTKNTALGNLIGRLTRLAEKKQKDGGKLILAD
ncbi:hypothetical protein HOD08_00860, partial [bacterium]|nr:hypothetical protein [bacterium]